MARPGLYISVGPPHSRRICRVGLRTAIPGSRNSSYRSEGCAVRRSAQGRFEARAMQIVRQGMHSGEAGWSADGVVGRIMRRLLQLQTWEARGGEENGFGA